MQLHHLDPSVASDADLLPAAAILGEADGERRQAGSVTPADVAAARLRIPGPTQRRWVLVAGATADPDGAAVVEVEDGPANAHIADVTLAVRPDRRRRGVGRALVDRVVADVAEAGKRLLITSSDSTVPEGGSFAEALGFERGLVMRINRLDLASLDHSLLDRWIDGGDADGYELVRADGRIPDELVPAALQAFDAMNDAPTDDLDVEDEITTEEQVRAREAASEASGARRLLLVARHHATGEGAGFTNVQWQPHVPAVLWQGGTATRKEHRGHALGRWMKAAMLRWAIEALPEITEVRTENAHTNPHMLAINDALGFEPWGEELIWQRRLAWPATEERSFDTSIGDR